MVLAAALKYLYAYPLFLKQMNCVLSHSLGGSSFLICNGKNLCLSLNPSHSNSATAGKQMGLTISDFSSSAQNTARRFKKKKKITFSCEGKKVY